MILNFKISELLYSNKAIQNNIDNIPKDPKIFDNMLTLIVDGLQPIRDMINKPMIVSSGYRCPQLNRLIGGSAGSEHLYGMAADFNIKGLKAQEAYNWIKKGGFKYTQLILEFGNMTEWVHLSYNPKNLKRENLIYKNGRYIADK